MKRTILLFLLAIFSISAVFALKTYAADTNSVQVAEFCTIRWQGIVNSKVIRPNGKIDSLKNLFERAPRPEGVDVRAYYLNVAMNALAKEGYDFAGMTVDEIVMKRKIEKTSE